MASPPNTEEPSPCVSDSIKKLGNIKYKNYVRITFSNTSSGILKNAGRACNNAIYTTLGSDMKIVGGNIVATVAFAVDILTDYSKYGDNPRKLAIAYGIDIAAVGASLLAAAIIASAPATMSIVVVAAVTVAAGSVIAWTQESFKNYYLG